MRRYLGGGGRGAIGGPYSCGPLQGEGEVLPFRKLLKSSVGAFDGEVGSDGDRVTEEERLERGMACEGECVVLTPY